MNNHLYPSDGWFASNLQNQSNAAGVVAALGTDLAAAIAAAATGTASFSSAVFNNGNGVTFGFDGTHVTGVGVEKLRQALPACEITL